MKTRNNKNSNFQNNQNIPLENNYDQIQDIMRKFAKMSVPNDSNKIQRLHTSLRTLQYFKMILKKCQNQINYSYKIDKASNVGQSISYFMKNAYQFIDTVRQQRQNSLKYNDRPETNIDNTNDEQQRFRTKVLCQQIRNKQDQFERKKNFDKYQSEQSLTIKKLIKQQIQQQSKIIDNEIYFQHFQYYYNKKVQKCEQYINQQQELYKLQMDELIKKTLQTKKVAILNQKAIIKNNIEKNEEIRQKIYDKYHTIAPICINPHLLYQQF